MQSMWREDLKKGMTPFQFLLFSIRPYKTAVTISLICTVIAVTLETGISYVFKMIFDAVTQLTKGGSIQNLQYAGYLYVGFLLGDFLLRRTSSHFASIWGTGVRATARYALTAYALGHSTHYFANRFAGGIQSKIGSAAGNMRNISNTIGYSFVGLFVAMTTSTALAFITNPTLGLILATWIAFVIPLNIYLGQKRAPIASAAERSESALVGATVDTLTNISAVEDYAQSDFELSRLKKITLDRREKGMRNWRYGNFIIFLNNTIQIIFTTALLLGAIHFASIGIMTAGDIALVLSLIILIQGNLSKIGETLSDFAEAWATLGESLDDILIDQDIPDKKGAKPLVAHSSSITFDEMSFMYGETKVFDKLSLTIPHGQKVGLVGRSGAGKSTLVKLLLRHYDLTGGRILIGDENIAEVTKDSLRRTIAVVPQEPLLFHRSIKDNIAYGKPGATEEEVIKAAKLAEAHAFILQVPEGYDALVGERGVKLSGGQRQRIVIARAILKDAPILLLDEATSALDSESEGAVQKALFTLMEHRTVIAIAHRLSTLRAMDRIIVMDEGKIIEDGTHEELLAKNGVYAMLWNHQAGGFIEE